MKAKKAFCTSLALMLILSILNMIPTMVSAPVAPTSGTVLWVNPTSYDATGMSVCQNFTVDIMIYNITALWSMEFKLWYNSTLIDALDVIPGAVMTSTSYVEAVENLVVAGRVWYGWAFLAKPSFNGSGVVCSIKFHIEHKPVYPEPDASCVLYINETLIGDDQIPSVAIPHTTQDGEYKMDSTAPVPPTACFTENVTMLYVNETVEFDASCSSDDGWITTLIWNFGDSSGPVVVPVNPPPRPWKITHKYTSTGTFNATLIVTDNHGLTDIAWSIKMVVERPVGAYLDVTSGHVRQYPHGTMTPNIGEKTGVPCEPYAPGEVVTLYAKVTYNDAPVNHILVAFEVLLEYREIRVGDEQIYVLDNETCITYRTAETNKSGIATTSFRIPMPCEEPLVGKWIVIAKAKVQDDFVEDQMRFDMNYILRIWEAWTTPGTTFYREEDYMGFCVWVKSISWIPRNMTLVVVVYDECQVPLFQCVCEDLPSQYETTVYCDPVYTLVCVCEVLVPQWAYVGNGMVYYNLFTHLPRECGVPYCPEASSPIVIKWAG